MATTTEKKSRLWQFLIYPDSAGREPDEIWEYLDSLQIPMFVSPLHDRDMKDDGTGELKKEHWHAVMAFDGPVPYSQALAYVEPLGVKILKAVPSRRTMERYWAHLDSPNKAQYDVADCRCFGGYEPKFLEDEYALDGLAAIHDVMEQLGIIYYADLADEIITRHPEMTACLLRYSQHFNNVCYSRERMARATGDNVSYVKSRRKVGR